MKEHRVLIKVLLLANVFGWVTEHFWASISPYVKWDVISALLYRAIIRIKYVSI